MREDVFPNGWRKAMAISNRRYVERGGWFSGILRTCFKPETCSLWRANRKCIGTHCILRYPEIEDLFKYVK